MNLPVIYTATCLVGLVGRSPTSRFGGRSDIKPILGLVPI